MNTVLATFAFTSTIRPHSSAKMKAIENHSSRQRGLASIETKRVSGARFASPRKRRGHMLWFFVIKFLRIIAGPINFTELVKSW